MLFHMQMEENKMILKKIKFLVTCLIFFLSFNGCTHNYIITNSKVGNFELGTYNNELAHENREKFAKQGLFFTFENEILTSIYVTNKNYKTADGISIGYKFDKTISNDSNSSYIENDGIIFVIDNFVVVGIMITIM